jgi:hypothetical protein
MLIFKKNIRKFTEEQIISVLSKIGSTISDNYINSIVSNKKNRIIFYSIGVEPDIYNCPCGLIYNVEKKNNVVNIYIMFIATAYKLRKVGYASLFIKEFTSYIKEKYKNDNNNVKIILDSIIDAVTFYEYIGFKWVTTDEYNKTLKIEDDNEHFIMIYEVD